MGCNLRGQIISGIVTACWCGPLQEIGREFGGKHHTTVMHSIKKIETMRRTDEALNRTIIQLMGAFAAQT